MICQKCGTQFDGYVCPNCGEAANAAPQMPLENAFVVERREIAMCVILSIVTFGIYALYWVYKLNDEMCVVAGEESFTAGGTVVLLIIVTFGIYGIYWNYKQGERVDRIHSMRGVAAGTNTPLIYLLISLIGLSLIDYALMQNELNMYA